MHFNDGCIGKEIRFEDGATANGQTGTRQHPTGGNLVDVIGTRTIVL